MLKKMIDKAYTQADYIVDCYGDDLVDALYDDAAPRAARKAAEEKVRIAEELRSLLATARRLADLLSDREI